MWIVTCTPLSIFLCNMKTGSKVFQPYKIPEVHILIQSFFEVFHNHQVKNLYNIVLKPLFIQGISFQCCSQKITCLAVWSHHTICITVACVKPSRRVYVHLRKATFCHNLLLSARVQIRLLASMCHAMFHALTELLHLTSILWLKINQEWFSMVCTLIHN